jgi:hypothetical protein
VGSHELSPELQARLKESIGSYEEPQVLLQALRERASWSAEDAARRLHRGGPALEKASDGLLQAGLLVAIDGRVAEERKFLYRPASPALAELSERLAEALDRDPLQVLDLTSAF